MESKIIASVTYDPSTGIIKRIKTGVTAGYSDKHGYIFLKIGNKRFSAHRIAWFFIYGELPEFPVDHIDGNVKNNSIANLRSGAFGVNQQNSRKFIGVTMDRGKFKAQICVCGKSKTIGRFTTFDDARLAYIKAKITFHPGCAHFSNPQRVRPAGISPDRLAPKEIEMIHLEENNFVVKDGNYVIFKAPNQWDYEIPVRDLTSQYFIAEWIRHMAEKSWVTKEMICQFAHIVQQINTTNMDMNDRAKEILERK